MKRYIVMFSLLFCCMTAYAYNPYAPNQFDTMDRNSWEYKSVKTLTEAGLTGATLQKFDKSYSLTRYEMTEMVAYAMAHKKEANAQQIAEIERLEEAFANDLDYMGVNRKKEEEPTVVVQGETRIRYTKDVKSRIDNRTDVGVVVHIPN